jgi:hypothetical protein
MGDDAAQYRAEWSTRADRAPSDVYVPAALREAADVAPRACPEGGTAAAIDNTADTVQPGDTATVVYRRQGQEYVIRLTDTHRSPGRVSGRITGIEEVPQG